MMFCGHNVVWHTIWQWHRHAFTWKHIHNYITMWNQPINNSTEAGCKNSSVCLHHPTSCQYTHVMAVCCVWCTRGWASACQSVNVSYVYVTHLSWWLSLHDWLISTDCIQCVCVCLRWRQNCHTPHYTFTECFTTWQLLTQKKVCSSLTNNGENSSLKLLQTWRLPYYFNTKLEKIFSKIVQNVTNIKSALSVMIHVIVNCAD